MAQDQKNKFDYKNQPDSFYKEKLTKEQYNICREAGTERAFTGDYNNHYEEGVYYCACCGGDYPLYSSTSKYNSGTGWPSFWEPYDSNSVEYKEESNIIKRIFGAGTEVICKRCGSHLGHVFDDGPEQHTGKRHCINSKALLFVPKGEKPKRTF